MQQSLQHSLLRTASPSRSPVRRAAIRRFSRRLFGIDPQQVNQFLAATEANVTNLMSALEHERATLAARLKDAAVEAERLRAELNAAEQCAAAYREQEGVLARALVTAQKTAEELVRTAQLDADEIVRRAEKIGNDIVQTGCRSASEILQEAQQDADDIMETAAQKAHALVTRLQAEAERLVTDAHEAFRQAQRTVAHDVAALPSRLELPANGADAGLRNAGRRDSLPPDRLVTAAESPDAGAAHHLETAALRPASDAPGSTGRESEPDGRSGGRAEAPLAGRAGLWIMTAAVSVFWLLRRVVAV